MDTVSKPKLSTVDLIRMLPLDEAMRANLLFVYPDKLSYEDKAEVEDTMWEYYAELFDSLYEQRLREMVAEGPLPTDYETILNERVAREIATVSQTSHDTAEIQKLRTSLATITPLDGTT
ncbi:MAG: hypothetical protein WCJ70_04100 [bacterium]